MAYTLGQAFPEKAIYKEQSSQIDRPAFYIGEIKAEQNSRIGNHYRRTHQMVVRYFPQEDNLSDYEDLGAIADKLYYHLEFLKFDGVQARAIQMNHRIEDNVLQFFLTVHLSLKRPENEAKMAILEANAYLKDSIKRDK